MRKTLSIVEAHFNPRHVLTPLTSIMRQQPVDATHVRVYRDWLVFGVRVLRFQLNLIGR